MLNVSERPSSPNVNPQRTPPNGSGGTVPPVALGAWLNHVFQSVLTSALAAAPQIRQRGNVVYILCEGTPCPTRSTLTEVLTAAIAHSPVPRQLSSDGAPIHRLVLYGRAIGAPKPAWAETFELSAIDDATEIQQPEIQQPEIQQPEQQATANPSVVVSRVPIAPPLAPPQNASPAQKPTRPNLSTEGIAHHLSRQLSAYNIAVRVRRKPPTVGANDLRSTLSRLYIVCESTYAPDPNVIAEPLAQCLRELALRDCQDAVISGQAKGESEPEWLLRVDLTPADRLLRQRAKWGDTTALSRLLNSMLRSVSQSVQVSLEQTTLHVAIRHPEICPPQTAVVKAIDSFFTDLAPQGIHGASLYGIQNPLGKPEKSDWVHWLDLPATQQIELTASPIDLAARGNPDAIAQLLLHQLNPDLDAQLATGGIRVQVRQREDVLHIMTDSLICPNQKAVSSTILTYLPTLNIDGISGLCLYGRQAGHNHASWRQGVQLGVLQPRFVPASSPEFTASDSYVEDLLSPPGALVFIPSRVPKDWGKAWGGVQTATRSLLLKTPLFAPLTVNQRLVPIRDERVSGPVAVVWGLLGVCLMVSGDWALGFVLKSQGVMPGTGPVAVESREKGSIDAPTKLPNLTLNKSGIASDDTVFNASGFTQEGKTRIITSKSLTLPNVPVRSTIGIGTGIGINGTKNSAKNSAKDTTKDVITDGTVDANLPVSPLMPKAQVDPAASPYPSLNAAQLDERLALYQQYVAQFGVPDVLVVGSSRALRGVDPSALQENLTQQGYSDSRVFNFGINGATAQVVDLVLRRLIPPEQLPKTIVWADGSRAFNSGRTDVTFNAIASSDGYKRLPAAPIAKLPQGQKATKTAIDTATPEKEPQAFHNALSDSYKILDRQFQDWLKSVSAVGGNRDVLFGLVRDRVFGPPIAPEQTDANNPNTINPNTINPNTMAATLSPTGHGVIDIYGFLPLANQFNPATYYQKYSKVTGAFDSDYDSFQLQGKQQDALDAIAQFTQARGITLVFVNLPLTAEYLDARRRDYEEEFQQAMLQASQSMKFTYRDLSSVIAQQNALFSDPSHLNRYGAYDVSMRLARDPLIGWNGDRKSKSSKSSKSAL